MLKNDAFGLVSGLPLSRIMSPTNGCMECESLYEDLTSATMDYYKVLNQFEFARLQCDSVWIEKLDALRCEAVIRRDAVRNALHRHIAGRHESAAAGSGD